MHMIQCSEQKTYGQCSRKVTGDGFRCFNSILAFGFGFEIKP